MESSDSDENTAAKESSAPTEDNGTFIDNDSACKRKTLDNESPSNTTFKKARFSWQVKGTKGKNSQETADVCDDKLENSILATPDINSFQPDVNTTQPDLDTLQSDSNIVRPELNRVQPVPNIIQPVSNTVQPKSVTVQPELNNLNSNQPDSSIIQLSPASVQPFRETLPFSSKHQFHSMVFDPPSSSKTDYHSQSPQIPDHPTIPIVHEETDILSSLNNISGENSGSLTNPPRIKHISTSLHTCFLTARPPGFDASLASVSADSIPVVPPLSDLPNSVTVSVISPNNNANAALSNDERERIEFRNAMRSIHTPNLSAYEKWQKRNTAGAIVDNVFNQTLEEMGISPDAASNRRALERSAVENESIMAAISSQGLTANGDNETETEEEGSEVQDDFAYVRQNRDVFDRAFERLGYMRYDIIHQHIPSTQSEGAHTESVINPSERTDTGTQTIDGNYETSQTVGQSSVDIAFQGPGVHKNANDKSVVTSEGSISEDSGQYKADLNITLENIPTTSLDTESASFPSQVNVTDAGELKGSASALEEVRRGNETKEKDVDENVLNLALSAAIQSQGLKLNFK